MKQRSYHIDLLRAISILGVIAIHTLYFNLTNQITNFLWNYLHFVVGGLVFCSGYVLAQKQDVFQSKSRLLAWYVKRLRRLIIPYYLYIVIHFSLVFLLPLFFSGIGFKRNSTDFIESFLFSSKVNISWLPLLFIQLTIIFPLLIWLFKKRFLIFYTIAALITTVLLTVKPFPINYFFYMWIPWSLITIMAIIFADKEKNHISENRYLITALISGIMFLGLFLIWIYFGKNTKLIDNEYPPNIFHLAYAIFLTTIMLIISSWQIFQHKIIIAIYTYLSTHSYSLYFIHFIVLDFILHISKKINYQSVIVEFILVIILSIIISKFIDLLQAKYFKKIKMNL